ncbi:MAG: hypothetical protein E7525_02420 [Ruminococcaceae bacterium]|nr:hypothetical protein [Oscillospiraceae bacterium]
MMKKIIAVSLVLCAVALAGCANEEKAKTPSSGSSEVSSVSLSTDNTSDTSSDTESKIKYTSGDYSYFIVDDGIVITEYHGSGVAHVVIPETIDGRPVVEIKGFGTVETETVVFPETLKRIGESCFYRCLIERLHIPASVEYIGGSLTFKVSNLKEYTVDPGNKYYTAVDGVIYTKDMKELVAYPEGAERTEFSIPKGVEIISVSSFGESPYELKKVFIPAEVKEFPIDYLYTVEDISVDPNNRYYCVVDGKLQSR